MAKKAKKPVINDEQWKELKSAVRRYNTVVRRMLKNSDYKGVTLPEPKKATEIRKTLMNKRDYNREMRSLTAITKPGADKIVKNRYGVKTIKYLREETNKNIHRINRNRAKKLQAASQQPVTVGGKPTGFTRGQMGSPNLAQFLPKKQKFSTTQTAADWKRLVKNVEAQSRGNYEYEKMKRLQDNYIAAIWRNLGIGADSQEIVRKVRRFTPQQFVQMYDSEMDLDIDFLYDEIEMQIKIERINDILDAYLGGLGVS